MAATPTIILYGFSDRSIKTWVIERRALFEIKSGM